ncbi:MAG: hypothetical protein K2W80_07880 [Burkholderiales bacterium]|nr:hypothetical protein [Burkholderiales bacterium]
MERSQNLIYILWPSFLVAGAASGVFFTLFDPADLHLLGDPVAMGELSAYTVGFFLFWLFAAAASALTCFLQRSSSEVNGMCPIADASDRPPGCPRRGEAGDDR